MAVIDWRGELGDGGSRATRFRVLAGWLSRAWALASGTGEVRALEPDARFFEEVRVWMAKEVAAEADRGATFTPPLTQDELAFYDAAAHNESAVDVHGHPPDKQSAAIDLVLRQMESMAPRLAVLREA